MCCCLHVLSLCLVAVCQLFLYEYMDRDQRKIHLILLMSATLLLLLKNSLPSSKTLLRSSKALLFDFHGFILA